MQEILQKAEDLMKKATESLSRDLGTISTGRANPSLLDPVRVESYGGAIVPLKQIANVSATDSSTLLIQVWDKGLVNKVEKGIALANLGLNPMIEGMSIRVNIPKLSEERRKELCKVAKKYGEEKKIAIRNVRKDALENIKKIKKDFSEDLIKDTEKEVQNLTDKYCKNCDDLVAIKEGELLTI